MLQLLLMLLGLAFGNNNGNTCNNNGTNNVSLYTTNPGGGTDPGTGGDDGTGGPGGPIGGNTGQTPPPTPRP
jgi:hypothetical protein